MFLAVPFGCIPNFFYLLYQIFRKSLLLSSEMRIASCARELESTEDAGITHALVSCKLPKATAEDVQVPQNLQGTVEEAAVLPWLIAEAFAGGNGH